MHALSPFPGLPDHTCMLAGTCTPPAEDKTTEAPVGAGGDSSPTRLFQKAPDDLQGQMETLSVQA